MDFPGFVISLGQRVGQLSDLYWLFLDSLPLDQGRATVIFDDYTQGNTKSPE